MTTTISAETYPTSAAQRRNWSVMGTRASLMIDCTADEADCAAREVASVLAAIEHRMSSYRPDSEVSALAADLLGRTGSAASPPPVADDLREVLAACSWLESASDGLFSMYPRGRDRPLDVAGFVKGWAVDRAAEVLLSAGFEHWALGVGGDWRCHGGHPSGRSWRFGILDPTTRRRARAVVTLRTGAIATSGRYERGDHVVAPAATESRAAAASAQSFTVTGPQLAWADAFATVGLLLAEGGLGWVAGFEGYAGAVITSTGDMFADTSMTMPRSAQWDLDTLRPWDDYR
jgi:thiamine biosynthesis lipoprotein